MSFSKSRMYLWNKANASPEIIIPWWYPRSTSISLSNQWPENQFFHECNTSCRNNSLTSQHKHPPTYFETCHGIPTRWSRRPRERHNQLIHLQNVLIRQARLHQSSPSKKFVSASKVLNINTFCTRFATPECTLNSKTINFNRILNKRKMKGKCIYIWLNQPK